MEHTSVWFQRPESLLIKHQCVQFTSQTEHRRVVNDAVERGVRFPVLRDPDCTIANRFGALTTPHVYIVDAAGLLVYEGAVDDRTFRQRDATVNYVDQALDALLAGEMPPVTQTQPYGCTIVRHA